MNTDFYTTLLTMSGTIILLMLGILGYFLKRIIKVLDNFDKTLRHFSEDYSATKERVANMQINCVDRHKTINDRLRRHGERLDKAESKIGIIEVQIK